MKVCLPCGHRFEMADWHCPSCEREPVQQHGAILFDPSLADGNKGFKAEHFAQLAEIEDEHFWFRNRNRLIIWALGAYFPHARKFLEIGCGTGYVLRGIREALPGLEVAGSELFAEGLEFARKRLPDVPLYQMDALRIPFEAEFDVVGAFDVLEHIEQDEAVLGQLFQAVKPGGGLMITVPQHPSLWSAADVSACHQRRYTRQELVHKVRSAGFKILRVTSFMTLLLPLMWASRLTHRKSKEIAANAEFQMSSRVGSALETALRFESLLIRQGCNFPAGGSLLLVARKETSA